MVPERFGASALRITVVQGLVEEFVDEDEVFADRLLCLVWINHTPGDEKMYQVRRE